jgi:hypothetical protein
VHDRWLPLKVDLPGLPPYDARVGRWTTTANSRNHFLRTPTADWPRDITFVREGLELVRRAHVRCLGLLWTIDGIRGDVPPHYAEQWPKDLEFWAAAMRDEFVLDQAGDIRPLS